MPRRNRHRQTGGHLFEAGPRTEPWSEAGRVAQLVIQTREVREWTTGETGAPSENDYLGRPALGTWIGVPIPLADRPAGILVAGRAENRPSPEPEILTHSPPMPRCPGEPSRRWIAPVSTISEGVQLSLHEGGASPLVEGARYGRVFSILVDVTG
jgi:hypothetical protein